MRKSFTQHTEKCRHHTNHSWSSKRGQRELTTGLIKERCALIYNFWFLMFDFHSHMLPSPNHHFETGFREYQSELLGLANQQATNTPKWVGTEKVENPLCVLRRKFPMAEPRIGLFDNPWPKRASVTRAGQGTGSIGLFDSNHPTFISPW